MSFAFTNLEMIKRYFLLEFEAISFSFVLIAFSGNNRRGRGQRVAAGSFAPRIIIIIPLTCAHYNYLRHFDVLAAIRRLHTTRKTFTARNLAEI